MSQFYIGNRPENEPPPIYDLYGVINHYGGILGGHYTAYSRTPDTRNPNVDEQGKVFSCSRCFLVVASRYDITLLTDVRKITSSHVDLIGPCR